VETVTADRLEENRPGLTPIGTLPLVARDKYCATTVYKVFAELVPSGVVTRTLLEPAKVESNVGRVQEISVALVMVKEVQSSPPTVTAEAVVKLVPVMVIFCPGTSVKPLLGLTAVTVGGITVGVEFRL
jgi:hypothetical protein